MTTSGGYFIKEDIRSFDNNFFGINNLEATYMDAEQRQLLEVVYECLESAGISLSKISETNVGCYVGKFTYDYMMMQNKIRRTCIDIAQPAWAPLSSQTESLMRSIFKDQGKA